MSTRKKKLSPSECYTGITRGRNVQDIFSQDLQERNVLYGPCTYSSIHQDPEDLYLTSFESFRLNMSIDCFRSAHFTKITMVGTPPTNYKEFDRLGLVPNYLLSAVYHIFIMLYLCSNSRGQDNIINWNIRFF